MFGFEINADSQREIRSLRDRLSNRLGATAVVRAEQVAVAQPELAVTLEDETGIVNLIVQPEFWKRHHQAACAATVLMAHGVLQRHDSIIHVLVGRLEDLSRELLEIETKSRDFR